MEGYQQGGGEDGGKVQGIRSINGRYKIDRGRVRIVCRKWRSQRTYCMTHGHELRWGNAGGWCRAEGDKGRKKKWDNCNSINNKIYFNKRNTFPLRLYRSLFQTIDDLACSRGKCTLLRLNIELYKI